MQNSEVAPIFSTDAPAPSSSAQTPTPDLVPPAPSDPSGDIILPSQKSKKPKKKLLLIIGGIILALGTILALVFFVIIPSSNANNEERSREVSGNLSEALDKLWDFLPLYEAHIGYNPTATNVEFQESTIIRTPFLNTTAEVVKDLKKQANPIAELLQFVIDNSSAIRSDDEISSSEIRNNAISLKGNLDNIIENMDIIIAIYDAFLDITATEYSSMVEGFTTCDVDILPERSQEVLSTENERLRIIAEGYRDLTCSYLELFPALGNTTYTNSLLKAKRTFVENLHSVSEEELTNSIDTLSDQNFSLNGRLQQND